ncbi:uncharacterized protein MONOS_11887 [Monocercomonoides exilis]|uniref:uncharacterized protein n=1 Tax=Monocercomonoides exilis TaxID=2049356 RepID=UPI003559B6A7|nr:hypothetical protein MONOS_11887 [Monocercomonoides exilis]|eukprot:MONOS_11887.1-p1 / transcript=MONOS_11887.1 / gene=MONOS_11887 / organism=Monocercomonoides_exilis_PA203 / gene_product=unspecified product / transcript_product=unspecified product / location=Mono_scaffold00622:6972-7382(-) / protein_length=136 / sequence_SO=supercontig / SO=protein_coding / is_pseudo=false
MSDEWRAYSSLKDHGHIHQTVNHSKNFVDPITQACTNTVEGMRLHLRSFFPRHGIREKYIGDYLSFWMVKKTVKVSFMDIVGYIVYGRENEREIIEEEEEIDNDVPDIDDISVPDDDNSSSDEISDGANASNWSED